MIKNPKLVGVSYVKKNRDVGDNCSAFTAPSVMGFSLYDQLRTIYIKIRNMKGNNNMQFCFSQDLHQCLCKIGFYRFCVRKVL